MSGTAVALPHGEAASIAYTRDADGLISQESDAGILSGTTAYTYDAKSELTQAGATGFGYDAAGNLTTNGAAAQAFGVNDELKSATTAAGATTYRYDAEGDRTGATPAWGPPAQYSYDQAGRLTRGHRDHARPDRDRHLTRHGTDRGRHDGDRQRQRVHRGDRGDLRRDRGHERRCALRYQADRDRTRRRRRSGRYRGVQSRGHERRGDSRSLHLHPRTRHHGRISRWPAQRTAPTRSRSPAPGSPARPKS